MEAKPILKWAGGKWKLCPQYQETRVFPDEYECYYEPFLGGAAVFLYLQPKKAVLTDINENLINAYKVVRDNIDELITNLAVHQNKHSKEYYYTIRKKWLEGNEAERASKLIYLNKTCFNGLYRVNKKGEFNVPIGDYKNPKLVKKRDLEAFSKILNKPGITIDVMAYDKAVEEAKKDDFVYFDPPYHPLTQTSSFTSYTKTGFTLDDQMNLRDIFRNLDKRGCFVLESNSGAPEIKELYADYYQTSIMAPRYINAKASGRKPIEELAITNYPPIQSIIHQR